MESNEPQSNTQIQVALNHQAIYVMDLKRAADFYAQIIGLQQIPDPWKAGRHAWFKTGEKTSLHVILGAPEKKEYYLSNHMCFSVHPFSAFLEKLNANNIMWQDSKGVKGGIKLRVDGVQQIWIQDPDGYWIEINDDPATFQ